MTHLSIEEVKARHELEIMKMEGVEGVGLSEDEGKPCITIYISKKTDKLEKLQSQELEGYPVKLQYIGEVKAF